MKILENAVRFATGSCQKFKADVWVEWKAPIEIYLNPMKNYWFLLVPLNKGLFCVKKWIRIKVYVRVFLGLRTIHKWYTLSKSRFVGVAKFPDALTI